MCARLFTTDLLSEYCLSWKTIWRRQSFILFRATDPLLWFMTCIINSSYIKCPSPLFSIEFPPNNTILVWWVMFMPKLAQKQSFEMHIKPVIAFTFDIIGNLFTSRRSYYTVKSHGCVVGPFCITNTIAIRGGSRNLRKGGRSLLFPSSPLLSLFPLLPLSRPVRSKAP